MYGNLFLHIIHDFHAVRMAVHWIGLRDCKTCKAENQEYQDLLKDQLLALDIQTKT